MAKTKLNLTEAYRMAAEVGDVLATGKIKIDWNGHFRSGNGGPPDHDHGWLCEQIEICVKKSVSLQSLQTTKVLVAAIKAGTPLPRPVTLGTSGFFKCYECGQKMVIQTDGVNWRIENPCPYPHGMPPIEVELNVPSGKMVVANDLRNLFPINGSYSLSTAHGERQTSEAYAAIGLAHCFVGNTCPDVYLCRKVGERAKREFVIGRSSVGGRNPRTSPDHRSVLVSGICTDLWWFSVCDYDEYVRRAKKTVEEADPELRFHDVVECDPGVYRFRHDYQTAEAADSSGPEIYTYVSWVRDADPVADLDLDRRSLNLSAGQVIYAYVHGHGLRLGKDATRSIMAAANYILCVIGTGLKYHENGFWNSDPDLRNDSPAVRIPKFDEPFNWYPLGDHSVLYAIAGGAVRVNDSFVALAFNTLRCMLTCGFEKTDGHSAATRRNARRCLKKMVARYPHLVPDGLPSLKGIACRRKSKKS